MPYARCCHNPYTHLVEQKPSAKDRLNETTTDRHKPMLRDIAQPVRTSNISCAYADNLHLGYVCVKLQDPVLPRKLPRKLKLASAG